MSAPWLQQTAETLFSELTSLSNAQYIPAHNIGTKEVFKTNFSKLAHLYGDLDYKSTPHGPNGNGSGGSGKTNSGPVKYDKSTYSELPGINHATVYSLMKYLNTRTSIYPKLIKASRAIFSRYDLSFINDNGTEITDSVFTIEEVKNALISYMTKALVDWLLLGYTVVGVPKDLLDYATNHVFFENSINPDALTSGNHHANIRMFNRMTQAISQSDENLLPFKHIDADGGSLQILRNIKTMGMVYLFTPEAKDLREAEKYFRTFVLVNPLCPPLRGNISTGLISVYSAYCRHILLRSRYDAATITLSRPQLITEEMPVDNKKRQDFTELESLVREVNIDNDINYADSNAMQRLAMTFPNLPLEAQRVILGRMLRGNTEFGEGIMDQAVRKATVKQSGRQNQNRRYENRVSASSTTSYNQSGNLPPPESGICNTTLALHIDELDTLERTSSNRPMNLADERNEITLMVDAGTKMSQYVQPVASLESVNSSKLEYERELTNLFDMLEKAVNISPSAVEDARGGTSKAKAGNSGRSGPTNIQIQATVTEKERSERDIIFLIKLIFSSVYREWGAFLDQIGPIGVLSNIQQTLIEINAADTLRKFITLKMSTQSLNTKEILNYIVGLNKESFDKKKSEGRLTEHDISTQRLVSYTIKSIQDWDEVKKAEHGILRLQQVALRAVSSTIRGNLRLQMTLDPAIGFLESGGASSLLGGGPGVGGGLSTGENNFGSNE